MTAEEKDKLINTRKHTATHARERQTFRSLRFCFSFSSSLHIYLVSRAARHRLIFSWMNVWHFKRRIRRVATVLREISKLLAYDHTLLGIRLCAETKKKQKRETRQKHKIEMKQQQERTEREEKKAWNLRYTIIIIL